MKLSEKANVRHSDCPALEHIKDKSLFYRNAKFDYDDVRRAVKNLMELRKRKWEDKNPLTEEDIINIFGSFE